MRSGYLTGTVLFWEVFDRLSLGRWEKLPVLYGGYGYTTLCM